MSVRKDERSDGKLSLFVEAKSLAVYTLQITANQKYFPAEQDGFTNQIRSIATEIFCKLWAANNIVVKTHDDWCERSRLQKEACVACNTLLPLIEIAWGLYHLSSKRVKYWAQQVLSVRDTARAWHQSDGKRYSHL